MPLAGDSLEVLFFLVASMIGAAISAVTVKGWRVAVLSCVAILFGFLAFGWWLSPKAVPWATALWHSGALVELVTIALVVLLVGGKSAAPTSKVSRISETPNMALDEATAHIFRSEWGSRKKDRTVDDVARELADKLFMRKLTAFGRATPTSAIQNLAPKTWERVVLNPRSGSAGMPNATPSYYDIQFDGDSIRKLWPDRTTVRTL